MSQSELLILGATGATGRHVLSLAREAGFKIHLLLRDPGKLADETDKTNVVEGDALDATILTEAMPSGGLAISCLGIGPKGPKAFYSDTAKAIVAATKAKSPKQVVVLSTLGTGSTEFRRTALLSGMFKMMGVSWILDDRAREEGIFKQSGLPITVLQSCLLSNGKPKGRGTFFDPGEVPRLGVMCPKISRADGA